MTQRQVNIRENEDGSYTVHYHKKPHGWTVFFCLIAGFFFVGWTNSAWAMVPWLGVILILWIKWRAEAREAMKPQDKQ